MRKYACCYAQGRSGAREFRTQVSHVSTPAEFRGDRRAVFSAALSIRASTANLCKHAFTVACYGPYLLAHYFSHIGLSKLSETARISVGDSRSRITLWTTWRKVPTSASSTCCARSGPLGVAELAQRNAGHAHGGAAAAGPADGQGLIDRELARAGRGRPSHRYALTEKGRRQTGANFVDLALALWKEVRAIEDPEVRRGLLQRIAKTMAAMYGAAGAAARRRPSGCSRCRRFLPSATCRSRSTRLGSVAGADGRWPVLIRSWPSRTGASVPWSG